LREEGGGKELPHLKRKKKKKKKSFREKKKDVPDVGFGSWGKRKEVTEFSTEKKGKGHRRLCAASCRDGPWNKNKKKREREADLIDIRRKAACFSRHGGVRGAMAKRKGEGGERSIFSVEKRTGGGQRCNIVRRRRERKTTPYIMKRGRRLLRELAVRSEKERKGGMNHHSNTKKRKENRGFTRTAASNQGISMRSSGERGEREGINHLSRIIQKKGG